MSGLQHRLEALDEQRSLENLRYELRCTVEPSRLGELLNWIALHRAGFRTAYPDRTVNNVYFDTLLLSGFTQNLAGISRRKKFRLRWYGQTCSPDGGMFEIKERVNQMGSKERHPVTLSDNLPSLTLRQVAREVAAQLPEHARMQFQASSEPVLINRYSRRYFVSFDGQVRVTIDRDLSFYDQRHRKSACVKFPANVPDLLIMECKFAAIDGARTRRQLGGLPGRSARCSKYMMGLMSMLGY